MRALPINEVMAKTGAGRTYIYVAMQAGTFPKPVRVGRRSAWIESEIEKWLADRISERDAGTVATDQFTRRARAMSAARLAKAESLGA